MLGFPRLDIYQQQQQKKGKSLNIKRFSKHFNSFSVLEYREGFD